MNGFHHFENGDRKLPDSLNVLPETSQAQNMKSQTCNNFFRNSYHWLETVISTYIKRSFRLKGFILSFAIEIHPEMNSFSIASD